MTSWHVLFNVILTTFLCILSSTIPLIADQTIQGNLALSNSLIIWVAILYLLGANTMVPIAGRLADLFGYRKLYVIGVSVFACGSGLAGIADNFFCLASSRYIEGIGAGIIFPVGLSLITQHFAKERVSFAINLYLGISFGGGLGLGMLFSGYCAQFLSWRLPFLIMFPCGIAAAIACIFIPESKLSEKKPFDPWGFFFFTLFITSLLIATTLGQLPSTDAGWHSPSVFCCFTSAALAFLATLYTEIHHPAPMIPFSLFKNPLFSLNCISLFLLGMAIFASLTISASYLIIGLGTEKSVTGLICLVYGVTIALSGLLANQLLKIVPAALLTLIGLSFLIASYFWNNILSLQTGWRELILILLLRGFGIGLSLGPTTTAALRQVPKELTEVGVTMMTFFRQVGATFSSTMIIIFSLRYKIFHSARYGEQINEQLPGYKATLMKLQSLSTADPYAAQAEQAKFLIIRNVETQAYIQALNDTVLTLGIITIGVASLLAIFNFWQWWKKEPVQLDRLPETISD